jgi:putative transcriptional regulator
MRSTEPVAGSLLVATPLLVDPNFARSVVLVLRHAADGTLGVILNRPTAIPVAEYLPDWEAVTSAPAVVFQGGPVEPEVGLGLAVRGSAIDLVDIEAGPADEQPVRIFAGYAGWGAGQLDSELAEGAWFVLRSRPSDLTTDRPLDLWPTVLRRQRSDVGVYATYPPDPRMN